MTVVVGIMIVVEVLIVVIVVVIGLCESQTGGSNTSGSTDSWPIHSRDGTNN